MKSIIIYVVTALSVLAALSASVFAGTIYIKPDGTGDYPTIQDGINAAATDDIVLLAAGTYTGVGNRDLFFMAKAITVTSESGRDATIIDCQNLGDGFYFSNVGPSSVLSGVTIQNARGNAIEGDYASSPTITNNTLKHSDGSGIFFCCGGSPIISNNIISDNSATGHPGGGIYCGNTFSGLIANNTITGNSSRYGGGIYCFTSSPTITDNTITGNSADLWGGGICCEYNSNPTISSNTIFGNSGGSTGGGISCNYGSSPFISNTIIGFSPLGTGISCNVGNPTLTNCDIYGNAGGDALCGTNAGGNISADPLFCGIPGSGNYSINSTSPCAPENHSSGQLIGAWPVACGPVSVEKTTWGKIKKMFE